MAASADLSTKFALDVQAVDGLRLASKKTGQAGLEAAARQFEALFMNMMLKSMREATPQDSLTDSEQSRLYISMLDQQLSQNMASRGIGLADIMVRQLRHGLPPDPKQETDSAASAVTGQWPAGEARPMAAPQLDPSTRELPPGPDSAALTEPVESGLGFSAPVALHPRAQSQAMDFQARLMPYAQEASRATGIPASFMLGQAALESGWGKREIRAADGAPSYNLFGVKAGGNWRGPVVEAVTTEYVNGVARKTVEIFRAYHSYSDAFRDYANLLRSNPRYADVLAQAAQGINAEGFAQGLQRAAYATDPNYADKLTRIIKSSGGY
jgi:flagellar protein FlgJ